MRGRDEEALFVLARLHAHGDINDSFVVAEHREILQQVALEKEETRDAWTLLFTSKSNFRRLLLGVALQFRYVLLFFEGNFDLPKNVFVNSVQMTGVSVIQVCRTSRVPLISL